MNQMRNLIVMSAAACALWVVPAQADHESPAKILGKWVEHQSRMHVIAPAANVRVFPASKNSNLADGVKSTADRIAGNGLGAVMLEHGSVVYEGYGNGASRDSKLSAYSITKSLTALAIGEAFCAGKIGSLDDLASKYVPEISGTAYGAASIKQLLSYTSGAQDPGGNGYVGIHNLNDFRAMAEHSLSLIDLVKKYGESQIEPGKKFVYNGLNSESLSLVIRSATGMSLPKWFESTVWAKAGAEFQAGWYVDKNGDGVAETGFYATTRDFARIGLYVADRLAARSSDTCMNDFVKNAAAPHVNKGYWEPAPQYGLGLHVGSDRNTWLFGHGAQRIGINVTTGRIVAVNGWQDWRGVDTTVQGLLAY